MFKHSSSFATWTSVICDFHCKRLLFSHQIHTQPLYSESHFLPRIGPKMWNLGQSILGGNEEDREGEFLENPDGLCNLSPVQRMYGFAGCLVAGFACMLLSLIVFAKPIKFAVLFTFGNLLAVGRFPGAKFAFLCGSTAFLIGPVQQIRMMFDPVRIYATAIYIGCVVLAFICALLIHNKILTIIVIIGEICAFIWYSLSYIPFARGMVSRLMVRFCDTDLD